MEREAPTVSVPAGELVYAIGDIHGRSDLLSRILDRARRGIARRITEDPDIYG